MTNNPKIGFMFLKKNRISYFLKKNDLSIFLTGFVNSDCSCLGLCFLHSA